MSENTFVLEMTDICKSFPGVKALDNARLMLRPGTVHALMGENGAGKSTLMKCLFGVYIEDSGTIKINDEKVKFISPIQALKSGVAMVHQELNQVQKRNVVDNIWIGRYQMKGIAVDEGKMFADTKAIFEDLEIDINPKVKLQTLSVSQRQMVEIAKAVSYNSRILVLDEPTSSLSEKEVEHLFRIITKLKDKGCGIVYISHKMEEILKISDEVTVMRDGQWVATEKAELLTTEKIISLMVGRELTNRFPPKDNSVGDVLLEVQNLTAANQPSCKDVSFTLHKGEILGIAGLQGSRRTEVLETIFGIRKKGSGKIVLNGKEINNKTSVDAINNNLALITEERRYNGIFSGLSTMFNSIIANIKNYSNKFGVVNHKKCETATAWVIDSMKVKTPSQKTNIGSLSGGNQQKVIIGRWLLTDPEVLLLDEPTRGIDVGAKFEIYQFIIALAKKGKGVIMVSSEMPELFGLTDRMVVMSNGRLAGIVDTKQTNQEEILRLSAMYI